jgi:hypothetical protein
MDPDFRHPLRESFFTRSKRFAARNANHTYYLRSNRHEFLPFLSTGKSSDSPSSVPMFSSHPQHFLFSALPCFHPLKQFATRASLSVSKSHICCSNLVQELQILARLRFRFVHHFTRLVFLHQLRQFPSAVSTASVFLLVSDD